MIQLLNPNRFHTTSAAKAHDEVGGRMPVGLA